MNQKNQTRKASGGQSGLRTRKVSLPPDFESGASANSAIRPFGWGGRNRTFSNRIKVCCAAVTQSPNMEREFRGTKAPRPSRQNKHNCRRREDLQM